MHDEVVASGDGEVNRHEASIVLRAQLDVIIGSFVLLTTERATTLREAE